MEFPVLAHGYNRSRFRYLIYLPVSFHDFGVPWKNLKYFHSEGNGDTKFWLKSY